MLREHLVRQFENRTTTTTKRTRATERQSNTATEQQSARATQHEQQSKTATQNEQQSNTECRATEQHCKTARQQGSKTATEQPSNRATEQQSNRATEQQSNRATEQQSNRATKQQSNRATLLRHPACHRHRHYPGTTRQRARMLFEFEQRNSVASRWRAFTTTMAWVPPAPHRGNTLLGDSFEWTAHAFVAVENCNAGVAVRVVG